jgi:hypothetical protein
LEPLVCVIDFVTNLAISPSTPAFTGAANSVTGSIMMAGVAAAAAALFV